MNHSLLTAPDDKTAAETPTLRFVSRLTAVRDALASGVMRPSQ